MINYINIKKAIEKYLTKEKQTKDNDIKFDLYSKETKCSEVGYTQKETSYDHYFNSVRYSIWIK